MAVVAKNERGTQDRGVPAAPAWATEPPVWGEPVSWQHLRKQLEDLDRKKVYQYAYPDGSKYETTWQSESAAKAWASINGHRYLGEVRAEQPVEPTPRGLGGRGTEPSLSPPPLVQALQPQPDVSRPLPQRPAAGDGVPKTSVPEIGGTQHQVSPRPRPHASVPNQWSSGGHRVPTEPMRSRSRPDAVAQRAAERGLPSSSDFDMKFDDFEIEPNATAEEAALAAKERYEAGDLEAFHFFNKRAHKLAFEEGIRTARKEREKAARDANASLAVLLVGPPMVAAAIKLGGVVLLRGAAFAVRYPRTYYLLGGLLYGLLAPPGAPDLPANPADDFGRTAKAAVSPWMALFLAMLRKGRSPTHVATAEKIVTEFERSLGEKITSQAKVKEIMERLIASATTNVPRTSGGLEAKIVKLMKSSFQAAESLGLQNAVKGSSDRALGNRAHMFLKFQLELLDLELRNVVGPSGERLGVASEMFVKAAKRIGRGEWVYIQRIGGSKGIDAVMFSDGLPALFLDLKTGRLLSNKEIAPYLKAMGISADLLKQIPGYDP